MATEKKIGGISFVLEGVATLTYQCFEELYKGKLTADIRTVWATLEKECRAAGIKFSDPAQKEKPKKSNSAMKEKVKNLGNFL